MADAMTAPSVHIRDIADVVPICESHLRGACVLGNRCDYHHYTLPYLWQVHVPDRGWLSIVDQSQDIEKTYCDLKPSHQQQVLLEGPLVKGHSQKCHIYVHLSFSVLSSLHIFIFLAPPRCHLAPELFKCRLVRRRRWRRLRQL